MKLTWNPSTALGDKEKKQKKDFLRNDSNSGFQISFTNKNRSQLLVEKTPVFLGISTFIFGSLCYCLI